MMSLSRYTSVFISILSLSSIAALAQSAPEPPTQFGLPAAPASSIALWPENKMPGHGAKEPEIELPSKDPFHRITNVSQPTLSLFLAPKNGAPAPALIVCPGGGYHHLLMDKEGSEIAGWLNSLGISAFVLKYRVPNNREGALQDIQRSLSMVRARAKEWNIDLKHIGVIGFSAGGNLAAKASTKFGSRSYSPLDGADQQSCRPDFAVLVYPAYLDGRDGRIAADLELPQNIPPTLILHNEDDKRYVPGSKAFNLALNEAKAPHRLVLYPTGGHGYGLHCEKEARAWPQAAKDWFQEIGILK